MSKINDLTNERFGKLIAETMIRRPEMSRPIYWQCQCDCGNQTTCASQDLSTGKINSCGCLKMDDIKGERYGKLLVLESCKIKGKLPMYWKCLCDCGNETTVSGTSLRSRRTKSCGCNTNQTEILKFKRENPQATEQEIMKARIKANTKWNGECLEWTATTSNGYGVFPHKRKTMNASRAAWIAEYGEIPKDVLVCHHCDNRRCCFLPHMFLSDHKGNTRDMIEKGRDNFSGRKKLTDKNNNK